jgi:nucleoside-diphosphate kinase
MATNRTFTMIKPDAVANGHRKHTCNDYKCRFQNRFFKINTITVADAQAFLQKYMLQDLFYGELVEFMSRGPIVAILEKDAVEDFRTLIVLQILLSCLKELSVKHTQLLGENAVHGSDSDENAAIEGAFHFAGREQFW